MFVKFVRKWVSSLYSVPSATAVVHGICKLHRGDRSYCELAIALGMSRLIVCWQCKLGHVCLEAQSSSRYIRTLYSASWRTFLVSHHHSHHSHQNHPFSRSLYYSAKGLIFHFEYLKLPTSAKWPATESLPLRCGFATTAMATSL